ncbi:hypothetical protein ACP3V3_02945 [Vibrio sp. PNB22_3_1]
MNFDEAIHYAISNERLLNKDKLKIIGLATTRRNKTNFFHYAEIKYNSSNSKNYFIATHITGAIPSIGNSIKTKYTAFDADNIKSKLPKPIRMANLEVYFSQQLDAINNIEEALATIIPTTDNSDDALISGLFEAQCGSYIEHLNALNRLPIITP